MSDSQISVHPLTDNPTAAWKEISKDQKVLKLNVKIPQTPVESNKVRFVCMSDTHSLIRNIMFDIPDGDVFIHAGDFTKCGQKEEVIQFDKWLELMTARQEKPIFTADDEVPTNGNLGNLSILLKNTFPIGSLPHKHKIVIAGNHELSFDQKFAEYFKELMIARQETANFTIGDEVSNYGNAKDNLEDAVNTQNIRQYLTNCTYLEDSGIEIYGIQIYGSPCQPEYNHWAFNLKRGAECLSRWNKIPEGTEILITHTPPVGHGDLACSGVRAGCVELLNTVQKRVKPKYHIFGHIHEGYGVTSDGKIIYINASTCDINYIPTNLPVVFDVPLKDGKQKDP